MMMMDGGHVLVPEFRCMALSGLFCADVLRPLDLVPVTDFTYKYHPDSVEGNAVIDSAIQYCTVK